MTKPVLEVLELSKYFGDFCALDKVSLKLNQGDFHALLGENGAGKSTLVKCIIGYQPPSEGQILVNNREVQFKNPREAHTAGIGMVYQHFTLVPNMTVAENLVLVRAHIPHVLNWKHQIQDLEVFLDTMPFRVPLRAQVTSLSAGEKQKLEILKQLYLGRQVLFLDEPTSVLTPHESDEVLGLLHDLTKAKKLSVLMITHKFREVNQYADMVTVLRRGQKVGGGSLEELTTQDMARLMLGDKNISKSIDRVQQPSAEPRLRLDKLEVQDDMGVLAVRGLSLSVLSGQIVGIAGVSGNGQSQLVEALAGQRPVHTGEVLVDSEVYGATRREIKDKKVNLLPEMPLENSCVGTMGVPENLAFRNFDEEPIRVLKYFISKDKITQQAKQLIEQFGVKVPSADAPIRTLSGGNVQRAVLARELSSPCRVLIATNPCFGLDFAATAEVRARIMKARNEGTAVLLISEDLDELFELSDRLCVMFDGQIVYETDPKQADLAMIGQYMAGKGSHDQKHQSEAF